MGGEITIKEKVKAFTVMKEKAVGMINDKFKGSLQSRKASGKLKWFRTVTYRLTDERSENDQLTQLRSRL